MKISVKQEKLAHGLGIVSRAVSPRSTLPVLANVLLATDEGRLRLSATNLELGITSWIGAKIEEEGTTTVPARTFSDLVNTLPNELIDMELTLRTQTLNVRCERSTTDIKCIDAQEFPPMHPTDPSDGVQIDIATLKEIIHQVTFAASADDARPILTGVLVIIEGGELTMAAADGFRLSVRKTTISPSSAEDIRVVIPARALTELARIAPDDAKIVTMLVPPNRGQVVFRLQDIELTSQLIEGVFPEYTQIIPQSFQTRTVIPTGAFLKGCKQAEIFAREGSNIARLNVVVDEETEKAVLEISAQSEETGSSETKVEAEIEGSSVLIAFNVRFLREVLEVVKTKEVALETTAAAAPGVIRPVGDEEFLHVIMPMHLGT